jgi:hypothetical protein
MSIGSFVHSIGVTFDNLRNTVNVGIVTVKEGCFETQICGVQLFEQVNPNHPDFEPFVYYFARFKLEQSNIVYCDEFLGETTLKKFNTLMKKTLSGQQWIGWHVEIRNAQSSPSLSSMDIMEVQLMPDASGMDIKFISHWFQETLYQFKKNTAYKIPIQYQPISLAYSFIVNPFSMRTYI